MRRFVGRGMDAFIQKPYTAAALTAKVMRILGEGAKSHGGAA
jgi:hypothetical protein